MSSKLPVTEKDKKASSSTLSKDIHNNATDPNSSGAEQISKTKLAPSLDHLEKYYGRMGHFCKHIITYYSCRFLELHIFILILLLIVIISAYKVCAFNMILIILVIIGLIFPQIKRLINLLTLFMTGFYILASMLYQLPIVKDKRNEKKYFVRMCSNFNSTLFPYSNDTGKWFGFEPTANFDRFIALYILLIIILIFDAIIRCRQKDCRLVSSKHEKFGYDKQQIHKDSITFLKYFIDSFFHRFGLEICYATTIIVVGIRLDMIGVFYIIWVILFIISSRSCVQRLWTFYVIVLTIIFPIEYMSVVGAAPFLCFKYPWTQMEILGWSQLKRWLFLPDYINPPSAKLLIPDFFQLLFVWQQWRVFHYKNKKDYSDTEMSESDSKTSRKTTSSWNFVKNQQNWIDSIAYGIYMHGVWIVLSIIYLYGIARTSLFHLIYIIICFYFFWRGRSFF